MTRKNASEITDPELDALYERLEAAEAVLDVVLLEVENWTDRSVRIIADSLAAHRPMTDPKETTR